MVFYTSIQHSVVSRNDLLLIGPDLKTNLVCVFPILHKEVVPKTVDSGQICHHFLVSENHNCLQFLWLQDKHPSGDIIYPESESISLWEL